VLINLKVPFYLKRLFSRGSMKVDMAFMENQMQAVFDNSADALFLVDDTTGRIIKSNKRAAELFDLGDNADFIERFCTSINKEPVSPVEIAFVLHTLRREGMWEGEVEYVNRNGETFWGAISIKLISIAGKSCQSVRITDITERVLVAERLKRSEAQLAEAQRMVSLGNWSHDYIKDVTYWSEEIYRIFGIDHIVPVPKREEYFEKYLYPADHDHIRGCVQKAIEQGYMKFDHRIICTNGFVKHLEVIVKRVLDDNGKLTGIFGTMRDITDRKIAEEVRKRSEEQVKASLREKELLLAEVHHRVKNNLAVISGLLGLQAGYVKDAEAKEMFYESRNRIRSMALIHDRLYHHETLSRIEFSSYISDLVSYIKASYSAEDRNISFRLDCNNVFIDIKNAVPCGLILNELVSNAYKHAFKGRPAGEIGISFSRQGNVFRLEVSDNGIGYHPQEALNDIPTLGLTLITSLVQQIEGTMEMKNTIGTTFTITFKG
jgi:PAS domain S-box-containing protein